VLRFERRVLVLTVLVSSTVNGLPCTFWPMPDAYRVFVVLDREFGDRLSELAQTGPVWIVDAPLNRAAVQKIWAAHPNRSNLVGVTMFKTGDDSSPEDSLINKLDTLDLHHGTYSADPPYTVLEVIVARMIERVKTGLTEFGFNEFQTTAEGFRAVRPLPSDPASGS
jgi:hypothetical protein